jgi:GH3 auxin-responsive promoter
MLGTILNAGLKLAKTSDLPNPEAVLEQEIQLRKLLRFARNTSFGTHHHFSKIIGQKALTEAYQQSVPASEYDAFYQKWWHRSRQDEPNVTWPGIIPYYALSSGTSAASSKYIPVTRHMIRAMSKGSMRLFFDLAKYKLSSQQFRKPMLMVGSCTALQTEDRHFTGDLSGIIGLNRPLWLANYYRPGREITDLSDWSNRIEAITREAHKWDIGFTVGNPAWVQLIFESIINRYGLDNIHDIWPNFNLYVHGGVFFEPYKQYFDQLLGKKVHCIDSYMASEGFFAYQNRPEAHSLRLLTDCGIYYEFVPLNTHNFNENGHLKPNAKVLTLAQVSEDEQYALLISTCSGAWRYLLGDTIQFTDLSRTEFKLTGRTGQFLSVCGEHISMDNLNEAVRRADTVLQAGVVEFAVASLPNQKGGWCHQWYVSMQNPNITPRAFAQAVDESLCMLNDDYAVERRYALHDVNVEILPKEVFYDWLAQRGKLNGQAKIPRVLKNDTLNNWLSFLSNNFV